MNRKCDPVSSPSRWRRTGSGRDLDPSAKSRVQYFIPSDCSLPRLILHRLTFKIRSGSRRGWMERQQFAPPSYLHSRSVGFNRHLRCGELRESRHAHAGWCEIGIKDGTAVRRSQRQANSAPPSPSHDRNQITTSWYRSRSFHYIRTQGLGDLPLPYPCIEWVMGVSGRSGYCVHQSFRHGRDSSRCPAPHTRMTSNSPD